MFMKCACKYISVGLFLVYGTLTLNLLSWVSNQHKPSRAVQEAFGPSGNVWQQNRDVDRGEVEYVDKNYEDILKYMENNAKRKRKILTELLKQYDVKPSQNKTEQQQFRSVGNIHVLSAYFDDRINFEFEVPVTRIIGILQLDSEETLVCRYTDTGSDPWILAVKEEMSDNHSKKYGGFMFICNTPPDIGIIPRKIYLQSLSSLGDRDSDVEPVSLDVWPIQSGRLSLLSRLTDGQDTDSLVNQYYQQSRSAPIPAWDDDTGGIVVETVQDSRDTEKEDGTEVPEVLVDTHGEDTVVGTVRYSNDINTHKATLTNKIQLKDKHDVDTNTENVYQNALDGEEVVNITGEVTMLLHIDTNSERVKPKRELLDSKSSVLDQLTKSVTMGHEPKIIYDPSKNSHVDIDKDTRVMKGKTDARSVTAKTNDPVLSVAVCIPPLFGSIPLSNFIQFMEMLHILGVSHVFTYKLNVSMNIDQMLSYYSQSGFVTVINWSLPAGVDGDIWNNGQIVAVQDCLYRTVGLFDYTAFIDIDELIIPKLQSDWQSMLTALDKSHSNQLGETGCYIFQSTFFDPDYPIGSNYDDDVNQQFKHSKLSIIRNVQRTQTLSKIRSKVIVRPDLMDQMGIHHVSKMLNTTMEVSCQSVESTVALVHHYRSCAQASEPDMDCLAQVIEPTVWKYEPLLLLRYDTALQENLSHLEKIRS